MLFSLNCYPQAKCPSVTLGQLFEELNVIDYSDVEPLTYKKFPSFSFKTFKPINGKFDSNDFFYIGFNKNAEIKEVSRKKNGNYTMYRLKVIDFRDHRLLIPITEGDGLERGYYGTAIAIDKAGGYNYLLGATSRFGENTGMIPVSVGGIDFKKFEDISIVMILDEDLYPLQLIKIVNGTVVFVSILKYTSDRKVDYAKAYVYFFPDQNKKLAIYRDLCPVTLVENCDQPQKILTIKPKAFDKKVEPLWDFLGDW